MASVVGVAIGGDQMTASVSWAARQLRATRWSSAIVVLCVVLLASDVRPCSGTPIWLQAEVLSLSNIGLAGTDFTINFVATLAYQLDLAPGDDDALVPDATVAPFLLPKIRPVNALTYSTPVWSRRWATSAVPAFVDQQHAAFNASWPCIVEEWHFRATMGVELDLQDFPFDKHWFHTVIRLDTPSARKAQLYITQRDFFIGSVDPAWKALETATAERNTTTVALQREQSEIVLSARLRRRTGYYRNKIISVMCALVIMGWLLFFGEMRDARRVQCISVLFLSLVAFNQSAQSSLPRVSYFTRLDVFTLFCIANMFLDFVFFNAHILIDTMVVQREQRLAKNAEKKERHKIISKALEPTKPNEPIASAAARSSTIDASWASIGPYRDDVVEFDPARDEDEPEPAPIVDFEDLPRWMAAWAANRTLINYGSLTFCVGVFLITAPIVTLAI